MLERRSNTELCALLENAVGVDWLAAEIKTALAEVGVKSDPDDWDLRNRIVIVRENFPIAAEFFRALADALDESATTNDKE